MTYPKSIDLGRVGKTRREDINFLAPNNFEFVIDRYSFPNVSFLVTNVSIPSFSIGNVEQPMSTRMSPQHADKVTYEKLTVQFIVDEEMENYRELHDWMLAQVIQNDVYSEDLKRRDVKLLVNSSHNNLVRVITYVDAFPVDLSPVEFNSTITAVDYITCTCTFAYSYFYFDSRGREPETPTTPQP